MPPQASRVAHHGGEAIRLTGKVDEMAARLKNPRGCIVKKGRDPWIVQTKNRPQLTLEALADVDAGNLIDHAAVQAWADSLGSASPLPTPRP